MDNSVSVYFNTHKKCFSVRQKGRVIMHAHNLDLENVNFKVWEGGRKRTLRDGKKYVHAFVEGEIVGPSFGLWDGKPIYYNPYKTEQFSEVTDDGLKPVTKADGIALRVVEGKPKMFALNPQ